MPKAKDLTAVYVNPSNISPEAQEFLAHAPDLSRSDYYRIIAALYERAAAKPLDLKDDGAWYCENCGSTEVDLISWVRPNENMRDAGSESPDDDTFCNTCEQHATAVHHDEEDAPLFCKCIAVDEYDEEIGQPKATWRSFGGQPEQGTCEDCGAPYTTVRPEVKE